MNIKLSRNFCPQVLAIFFVSAYLVGCGGGGGTASKVRTSKPTQHQSDSPIPNYNGQWSPSVAEQVIHRIGTELRNNAFAFSAPFERAPQLLEAEKSHLIHRSKQEFILEMNRTLRRIMGVSHVYLMETNLTRGSQEDFFAFPPEQISRAGGDRQPSLSYHQGVPVLKIPSFGTQHYKDAVVDQSMRQIAGQPALIVDLRGNPGGRTDKLMHFLSWVVNGRLRAGSAIGKLAYRNYLQSHSAPSNPGEYNALAQYSVSTYPLEASPLLYRSAAGYFYGEVVVLTDQGTASCGEIAVSALKFQKGSMLFGEHTAQATLLSDTIVLGAGLSMSCPKFEVIGENNLPIEHVGITPDYPTSSHGALARAYQYITSGN